MFANPLQPCSGFFVYRLRRARHFARFRKGLWFFAGFLSETLLTWDQVPNMIINDTDNRYQ